MGKLSGYFLSFRFLWQDYTSEGPLIPEQANRFIIQMLTPTNKALQPPWQSGKVIVGVSPMC